ncbi:hypothetical protein HFP48_10200 [Rhodococcus sp. DMU1]|nr:hypothetical protein HFP48_10200 [Rhodococcus sp. DMU1]
MSCRPRCLRTTCTATAPDAVRTFRTNATARTYLLSVPIRFVDVVNAQVEASAGVLPASNVLTQEEGIASVSNGLALCKIHHAAYDARILGITPDFVVEIRQDLLEEVDGPMLEHGLKERHGERLMVLPTSREERPDRRLLELSYGRFRSVG